MKQLLLVVALIASCAYAANSCTGTPNNEPIYSDPPVFVNSTKNGKLFLLKSVDPPIYVAHLYGSAYEMGYAHGTLLKTILPTFYEEFLTWVYGQIGNYINELPEFLQKLIEEYGTEFALDYTYYVTRGYTPQRFFDEMNGIADGAGVDRMVVIRAHMFPELIKAQCSMVGAWGPAIAQTTGSLYQLRALDWSTNGPFQQYPAILVYHPTTGHNFSVVTWTGFLGAFTGLSSAPVGICEKVWIHYNGTSTRSGIPWNFLLRDILQFDRDIDDALSRIASAPRTCSIFVGLGDTVINQFRVVEYSYERVQIFDDVNGPNGNPNHPLMKGVAYVDKGSQPTKNPCLGSLLEQYYGNISPVNIIRNIAPVHGTGDAMVAVYDFAQMQMYVAYPSIFNQQTNSAVPAYQRPFVVLDMLTLFAESQ